MKLILLSVAVVSALCAPSFAERGEIGPSAEVLRDFQKKIAPAKADPKPIAAVIEHLANDGVRSHDPMGSIIRTLQELTAPDAGRSFHELEAVVVTVRIPAVAHAAEPFEAPAYPDLTARFVDQLYVLDAECLSNAETVGSCIEWRYVVTSGGWLISVDRSYVPARWNAQGKRAPDMRGARSIPLAPSDPAVLERWEKLAPRLLGLRNPAVI